MHDHCFLQHAIACHQHGSCRSLGASYQSPSEAESFILHLGTLPGVQYGAGPYLTVTLTPNVDCQMILAHVHYYLRSNNGEFVHNV
jgi:hypothetical protein